MAILPVQTLLLIEPTPTNPRNSEGSLLALRDGGLALVYTRFGGGADDNSAAELALRTSADGGTTWSDDCVLIAGEGEENVMSVSLLRLNDGCILLGYAVKNGWGDCSFYVRRSDDELASLGERIRVICHDGYHVVNNDRMVQLTSGRIIVPTAWHPCPDGTPASWDSRGMAFCCYSDDGGLTWRQGETMLRLDGETKSGMQEPGVAELRDGRLYLWARTDRSTQFQSFSEDAGITWSEPTPAPLPSPCSPASIKRMPWNGALLCVWNDHSGRYAFPQGRRTPLTVAVSVDDAATWSPSRLLEGYPDGWYCYTAVTFVNDRALLAYCAGDSRVGGLNRLKVVSLGSEWIAGTAW